MRIYKCDRCGAIFEIAAFLSDPTVKIKTITSELPKDTIENADKTFDIVDAFMRLIWGRKVRMTHWDKDEYIELSECNLPLGCEYLREKEIINQDGLTYPAEYLFDKSHLDARWEDYKEEINNEQ